MNNQYDFSNQFAQPNPQYSFEDLMNIATGRQPQQGSQPISPVYGGDSNEMMRSWMKMMIEQMAQNRQVAQQMQVRPEERDMARARSLRYYQDPVGAAIADKGAQEASKGGIDWFKRVNNLEDMTPQQAWRTQGNTAMNQWRKQWGTY